MAFTLQKTVEGLQSLAMRAAHDASQREDLNTQAKCNEAIYQLLKIFDGKTDHFPACILSPNPHEDDVAEAKKEGGAWLNADVALQDNLSDRYIAFVSKGDWDWPKRSSGAYSQVEVTNMFLSSMANAATYWADVSDDALIGTDPFYRQRCIGAIFSAFAVMDGCNITTPMFDIVLDAEDIDSRPELSDFEPILIDHYLHAGYQQAEPFQSKASASPEL